MNKKILKKVGFDNEVKNVELGKCPFCNNKINQNDFKDELSKKEFGISGLCKKCQDKMFS